MKTKINVMRKYMCVMRKKMIPIQDHVHEQLFSVKNIIDNKAVVRLYFSILNNCYNFE